MKRELVVLMLFIAIVTGCAPTTPRKQEAAPPPPKFDFTPPETAAPKSADVILALVNPSYSEKDPNRGAIFGFYPFTDFQRNMGTDFEELLVARGFSVTGPFASREEMTFPDKNGCDLILTPSLDVTVDFSAQNEKVVMLLTPDEYRVRGTASVRGRLVLSMLESLSGEKMWNKSLEIPAACQTVSFVGEKRYMQPLPHVDPSDPGLQKALAPAMESAYNAILGNAWRYLDPAEIQMVKKEAMTIKEKKRY